MDILVADDRPWICSALRLLLEQESGIRVLGEAADLETLLTEIKAARPDLLLLDWELPGRDRNGSPARSHSQFLALLREMRPGLQIIALSSRPEARCESLTAGANAFVSKGDPPELLLATVHRMQHAGD